MLNINVDKWVWGLFIALFSIQLQQGSKVMKKFFKCFSVAIVATIVLAMATPSQAHGIKKWRGGRLVTSYEHHQNDHNRSNWSGRSGGGYSYGGGDDAEALAAALALQQAQGRGDKGLTIEKSGGLFGCKDGNGLLGCSKTTIRLNDNDGREDPVPVGAVRPIKTDTPRQYPEVAGTSKEVNSELGRHWNGDSRTVPEAQVLPGTALDCEDLERYCEGKVGCAAIVNKCYEQGGR